LLSATTLVPTYRRLKRHALHGYGWIGRRSPEQRRAPQLTMTDRNGVGGD
jgi:hypothetical protein